MLAQAKGRRAHDVDSARKPLLGAPLLLLAQASHRLVHLLRHLAAQLHDVFHISRDLLAIGHLHALLLLQHAHPLAQNVGLLRLAHLAEQLEIDGNASQREKPHNPEIHLGQLETHDPNSRHRHHDELACGIQQKRDAMENRVAHEMPFFKESPERQREFATSSR